MIHQTTCDRCGKPVSIKWTPEDIQSMESMGVDWKAIQGRCDDCQERIENEHSYETAPRAARTEPLSEADIKARIPYSKLSEDDEGAVYVSPDGLFPK